MRDSGGKKEEQFGKNDLAILRINTTQGKKKKKKKKKPPPPSAEERKKNCPESCVLALAIARKKKRRNMSMCAPLAMEKRGIKGKMGKRQGLALRVCAEGKRKKKSALDTPCAEKRKKREKKRDRRERGKKNPRPFPKKGKKGQEGEPNEIAFLPLWEKGRRGSSIKKRKAILYLSLKEEKKKEGKRVSPSICRGRERNKSSGGAKPYRAGKKKKGRRNRRSRKPPCLKRKKGSETKESLPGRRMKGKKKKASRRRPWL